MCDKLVFDLAQEVEGSPNVFIRKDWLNILDNQNQNYNNNQSVLDTSQLSNSNKYMSYREAYFSIPFIITLAPVSQTVSNVAAGNVFFNPATSATSADYSLGLKNWFGQIIHSFTLDYNGTTIIQQTPYINMWNSFKLMTSLSITDIMTQGATIGFYPDDPLTWSFIPASTTSLIGQGTCNNTNYDSITTVTGSFNSFKTAGGNNGFLKRQQLINFDIDATIGSTTTYGDLLYSGAGTCNNVWKSYITQKVNGTTWNTQATNGYIQYSVVATVYLKHIHSFFNMCPLLKGVFMKMTMNLNNTSTSFQAISFQANNTTALAPKSLQILSVANPLGGVNPLMVASALANNGNNTALAFNAQTSTGTNAQSINTFRMNISVGATCLDQTLASSGIPKAPLSQSVYLYIPAYTFNPVFEQAYLSSPVKQIKYTDVYQYQVLGIAANGMINNLLTNGIANVKSILILPFYSTNTSATTSVNASYSNTPLSTNTGIPVGVPVWQSPFDSAGTGTTSPMCWISNFNVQVSGQNAIYNLEKYNFEQFNNQLYGQNAVNGGLTDGLTSGLIDRQAFDMCYCYYYVNIERMLPVEQSVPKSIQLIGQNMSSKAMDYICFIEYGVEISIDALTGARV